MTWQGTSMYEAFAAEQPVPERVMRAVELSKQFDFVYSTHPATGRLLASLAGGVGRDGERTGGLLYRR